MYTSGAIYNNVIPGSSYVNMKLTINRFDILRLVAGVFEIPVIGIAPNQAKIMFGIKFFDILVDIFARLAVTDQIFPVSIVYSFVFLLIHAEKVNSLFDTVACNVIKTWYVYVCCFGRQRGDGNSQSQNERRKNFLHDTSILIAAPAATGTGFPFGVARLTRTAAVVGRLCVVFVSFDVTLAVAPEAHSRLGGRSGQDESHYRESRQQEQCQLPHEKSLPNNQQHYKTLKAVYFIHNIAVN